MSDVDSDPLRATYKRLNKRSQEMLVRALFARWGVMPLPSKQEPAKPADPPAAKS